MSSLREVEAPHVAGVLRPVLGVCAVVVLSLGSVTACGGGASSQQPVEPEVGVEFSDVEAKPHDLKCLMGDIRLLSIKAGGSEWFEVSPFGETGLDRDGSHKGSLEIVAVSSEENPTGTEALFKSDGAEVLFGLGEPGC